MILRTSTERAPIILLRGPAAGLRRHPLLASSSRTDSFTITTEVRAPVPWGGARSLLARLRAVVGDAAVVRALHPHRVILSLVLRGLDATLTTGEREARFQSSYACLYRLPTCCPCPCIFAMRGPTCSRSFFVGRHALDPELCGDRRRDRRGDLAAPASKARGRGPLCGGGPRPRRPSE